MKKLVLLLIIFVIVFTSLYPTYACTSFAVYSEEVIYGMNFDYPETEIKLVVNENNGMKGFSMQFKEGNSYQPTVGMNDKGLFASLQMQYPFEAGKSKRSEDEIFVPELGHYIGKFNNVDEILRSLENKKLVHWNSITLHDLFADVEGNAVIVEAGKEKNELIPVIDNFIVMTNFKNSDYRNMPYDEVSGVGSDRYKMIYKYILDNKDGFNINNAFEGLKMTTQNGDYPTLCSMVFKPKENCIYVALNKNFDKLWKISINNKTIETFKGFDKSLKFQMWEDGVIASDLINSNFTNYKPYKETDNTTAESAKSSADKSTEKQNEKLYIYLFIVSSVAAIFFTFIFLIKRHKTSI